MLCRGCRGLEEFECHVCFYMRWIGCCFWMIFGMLLILHVFVRNSDETLPSQVLAFILAHGMNEENWVPARRQMKIQRWTHPFDSYSSSSSSTTSYIFMILQPPPTNWIFQPPELDLNPKKRPFFWGTPPRRLHFSGRLQDDNGLSWEEFRELAVEVGELQGLSKPVTRPVGLIFGGCCLYQKVVI